MGLWFRNKAQKARGKSTDVIESLLRTVNGFMGTEIPEILALVL
jgi:hypothetical protein